ncbi:MAG: hypothetical protein BTN85_0552 [Candidatus Methanohalarchaeum thermophilum]|uniref:Uncharacterized protein n=1 Tax=Methanohalarchaeum thermophilum TaxID=1903181 RepID=A0A1Q6DUQ6_METT1|nr:MAG: hypothetical protein BTN85_0552 [Candidatus Methanohalarchaeum thermophilum]
MEFESETQVIEEAIKIFLEKEFERSFSLSGKNVKLTKAKTDQERYYTCKGGRDG